MLFNGRIITVDGAFSIAEAVAVAGDRIVAVGTTAEVRATAGPTARQVDLRGRAVIPGLMDNHLHSAGGGPGVDLSRARSLDDADAAQLGYEAADPVLQARHWPDAIGSSEPFDGA